MSPPVLLRPVNQLPVAAQCQRMQAVAAWAGGYLSARRVIPDKGWIAEAGMALSVDGYNALPTVYPAVSFPLGQFHRTFFGDLRAVPADHQLPHAGQGHEMQCPSIRNPGTFLPVTFTERSPLFGPFAMDTIQAAFQACDAAPENAASATRYFEHVRTWMAYPGECIAQALQAARSDWQTQRAGGPLEVIFRALDDENLDEAHAEISRAEARAIFSEALLAPVPAPPYVAQIQDQFTADVLIAAADVDQFPVHFLGVDFAVAQWLLGPDAISYELCDEKPTGEALIFGALRANGRDIPITADVVTTLIRHFGRIPMTGDEHARAVEFVATR